MNSLPSQRKVLTSLIKTISDIPDKVTEDSRVKGQDLLVEPTHGSSPLHAFPPHQRPLLLTLHVLFPGLLLPALDLIDRGLIIRLLSASDDDPAPSVGQPAVYDNLEPPKKDTSSSSSPTQPAVFLVKSLAPTLSRRSRSAASTSSSLRYMVYLDAWNCPCASFAFDSFPSNSTHAHPSVGGDQRNTAQDESGWYFEQLGMAGLAGLGADVPCCKHLLACLMVYKWPKMLSSYIENRHVTKEEMAGLAAEM